MNIYMIQKKSGDRIFQEGTSPDSALYKADLSWSHIEKIKKLDEEEVERYREWSQRRATERNQDTD